MRAGGEGRGTARDKGLYCGISCSEPSIGEFHAVAFAAPAPLIKLKEFKRIALRADKTDTSFKAMIYAVAALINSR